MHKSLATADRTDQQGKCFRVVPNSDDNLTLKFAKPAPSDTIYEHDGDSVLALPKALAQHLENKCMDVDSNGKLVVS